jgi:hypothetical protein
VVQRVLHGAKGAVLVAAAHGELVAVGAADDHRVGGEQAFHHGGAVQAGEALQDARTGADLVVLVADVVLDAEHQAGQCTGIAGLHTGIHCIGLLQGALVEELQEGVEVRMLAGGGQCGLGGCGDRGAAGQGPRGPR